MTLAAELAKEPTTQPQVSGRGRIVRPLGKDDDDEQPARSVEQKLQKDTRPLIERIREIVRNQRGKCIKSWEIALALRCEPGKPFFEALEILKAENQIKGVRGKGWRTLEAVPEEAPAEVEPEVKPELPYAGATLKLITKVQQLVRTEVSVTPQSLAERLDAPLIEIQDAIAYLRSVGEIRAMRGGRHFQTTKVDQTVQEPTTSAPPADVLGRVRALLNDERWLNVQSVATRLDLPFEEAKQAVDRLKALGELACGKGGKLVLLRGDETVQEPPSASQGLRVAGRPAPATKTPPEPVESAEMRLPALVEPAFGPEPRFGMDDAGCLGISVKGAAVQLGPEDIARLEAFMRKTKPLWKGEE